MRRRCRRGHHLRETSATEAVSLVWLAPSYWDHEATSQEEVNKFDLFVPSGSRDPVAHPVETSIAQRTAPDLVLWSDERGRLLEPAQEESQRKERPNWSKSGRELRTSSRTRVSAIGAATACELEPRTIHITDNHTKSLSSRSSWRTTALCRMHLAVN